MHAGVGSTPEEQGMSDLILRIQSGDTTASDEFCHLLMRGVRITLQRHLDRQDVADGVQQVVLSVLTAVSTGKLREPTAVWAFAATIVRRYVATYIANAVERRNRTGDSNETLDYIADASSMADPEKLLLKQERVEIARKALSKLKPKERELLTRFYIDEQSPEAIREDMKLTATQYRLIKARAKAKCTDVGSRIVSRPPSGISRFGKLWGFAR